MWSKERKIQEEMEMASAMSVFAAGLCVTGNIEANGDIRIDGNVMGDVMAKKKVIIGMGGYIKGDIHAAEVCVMGEVLGNFYVSGLARFSAEAKAKGLIYSEKIEIEAGADMEVSLLKFKDLEDANAGKELKIGKYGDRPVKEPAGTGDKKPIQSDTIKSR
ncbi:bactofilin family protein [Negadavirga shengliensis]|uniref:Polymer-forming cytoskeletal protein n=1 Tax=Negadavirga shengliensis TaxID=1389218 RepID=A0ABV9T2Z3_9BACT